MFTQTFINTLVIKTCPTCGINYGLPEDFFDRKHSKGGSWYCPNGHNLVCVENREEKLKRELEDKQKTVEWYEKRNNQLHTDLTKQKHLTSAQKAAKTKILKRVHNGVCPCCNRSFQNLKQHMATKHPEVKI